MSSASGVEWSTLPLGDSALLLQFGNSIDNNINDAVHAAARSIQDQHLEGCHDLVPAYASLAVHFDPLIWDVESLSARLESMADRIRKTPRPSGRLVTLPVHYGGADGADLAEVASRCGFSPEQLIERHSQPEYRVMFLGFSPGFAYLSGLDPALSVPRRSTPRTAVPAGSVGIGGAQTGVYPSATPGGWHLIGRTGRSLFDAHAAQPCLLQPGDRLRFKPVDELEEETPRPPSPSTGVTAGFSVEHPGILSSLQDLGRPGYQHLGVGPGGALDRFSHRIANLLVGNPESAPTLEMTMVGPRLVTLRAMAIAVCGAAFTATVDGAPMRLWHRIVVPQGARIVIATPTNGARAYLAVEGGFDVPMVLGSRSTALRDRFGGLDGRALRKGDELPVADVQPTRPQSAGAIEGMQESDAGGGPIRLLAGPEWVTLTDRSREAFLTSGFRATSSSDRMGVRLEGPPLTLSRTREYLSAGVATGTIQLPPDGQPIVLLAGRQTTGGYPRIGEVISADLDRVGQLRPGDALQFSLCSMKDARAALLNRQQTLDRFRAAINRQHDGK